MRCALQARTYKIKIAVVKPKSLCAYRSVEEKRESVRARMSCTFAKLMPGRNPTYPLEMRKFLFFQRLGCGNLMCVPSDLFARMLRQN